MKKEEAKAFIRGELDKGVSDNEIIATLMQQEKIGNNKPTEELILDLLKLVKDNDTNITNKDDKQSEAQLERPFYEEWQVDEKTGEKIKKVKDVKISEEIAARLNEARLTSGKGYVIKYFKQ
jgi:hypothetical protein